MAKYVTEITIEHHQGHSGGITGKRWAEVVEWLRTYPITSDAGINASLKKCTTDTVSKAIKKETIKNITLSRVARWDIK